MDPQVLARARARVLGATSVAAADPVPAGTAAATDGDRVWLLPVWPDGATPALLEEYQTAPMPLDRAGQARRVLAAALRCCWTRLDDAPWPGAPATVAAVLEVYADMSRGDADLARRWATGELRRLADTGWLLLDEGTAAKGGTVRPGPRVSLWAEHTLSSLRSLLHRLPEPPPPPAESHAQDPLDGPPAVPSPRPSEPAAGEAPASAAEPSGPGSAGGERASSAPPAVFRSPSVNEPAAPPAPAAEKSLPVDNLPPAGPGEAEPDPEDGPRPAREGGSREEGPGSGGE
ncbi:hypothetical protein GCM10009527_093220 [Actinomadura nitritigenes]|uniref:hypothetical protein n=1 Tax=Actinomadura nitritigenes TaxID=134602 RepID=UPI001FB6FB5F|nr:hypothetical protein [Actinomadura nitritigenes]